MPKTFRTPIQAIQSNIDINHLSNTLLLGSCFAENMAEKLERHLFPISFNPFGILYNAFSISKGLHYIAGTQTIVEKDLIFHNSLWHSKWHHGHFSGISKEETLDKVNFTLNNARNKLKNTNILVITLGTAFVYKLKSTNEIVGNCHKLPSDQFIKSRQSIAEVVACLSTAIKQIIEIRPELKIIFTVSPVRHLKDGFIENQRSKSILLLACEQLTKELENAYYFPAYEIMMDELRDYRFYATDMLHPNKTSISHIWDLFQETFFSIETKGLVREINQLKKELDHRPLHPNSEAHLAFVDRLKKKIEEFEKKYAALKIQVSG